MDWLIFRIRFTLKGFAAYEKKQDGRGIYTLIRRIPVE